MAEKKVTPLTREERIAFVERAESDLPLTMQTELLNLNRSSLYYQPHPPRAEEVVLKHRIDARLHPITILWCSQNCRAVTARRNGD